ncbi:MAG: hypothetical protein JST38_17080 [Bacteroidetes bacterium]|nr:hypothetical protein [Bacteroidota bacterium]
MSEQDIIELLAHPMVRHMVRRLANQEARKVLLAKEEPQAPRGHVSIAKAAELLGYAEQTIRAYKSQAKLRGHRGWVSIESIERMKRQTGR